MMPVDPKPVLAFWRLPVFRVHHTALEDFICRVFGFDEFDFLMATGTTEGICPDYRVTGEMPSTEASRRANELRRGKRTRDVTLILNTLAQDGYIPKGLYTVSTHKLPDPVAIYTSLLHQTRDPFAAECVHFKQRHKADATFQQRAAVLDKCMLDFKDQAA
jgi:hypothetical protein